jgi:CRISPR/Cas system CSM-associated protein Csm2 small subunit
MDKLREEIARKYHNLVMNEFLHTEKDIHIDKKRLVSNLIDRKQELSSAILKLFEERIDKVMDDHEPINAFSGKEDLLFWYNRLRAELRKKVGEI